MALTLPMYRPVLFLLATCFVGSFQALAKPNIVFVITDDQGYGDVAAHGNSVIKTPHIDKLAGESLTLQDYHVAPTCSPTRAALLTGHWTNRTGVWHTINGRSMLRANEVTLGTLLQKAGYTTGMFGKWHLGDNYPYRPEDRGFEEVYRHGGGGVGQTPDVWDNSYFDGSYFHNGKIESAKGFCTDVFFEQANAFIRRSAATNRPFFAYICTNAPHGPLHCPQKYLDLYKDQPKGIAAFFGMITNIDDNVGKTRALLKELGQYEDTLFIFTTDNGTATGDKIFNAGMRGKKGSAYDGGHRVPFMAHWPKRGMNFHREIKTLTHAVDIVPTLLDYVGGSALDGLKFDGRSLKPLFEGAAWPDRFLVTDSQRVRDPIKWKSSSVMSEEFRLINGKELYHIDKDPGQKEDVAKEFPEQVAKMRAFYESWWKELEPTFAETTEIVLGHVDHPVVSMTAHDWIQKAGPPWNQRQIRDGIKSKLKRRGANAKPLKHEGHWAVKVVTAGKYRVSVSRWPQEAGQPITAVVPAGADVPGATRAFRTNPGEPIAATKATLRVDDQVIESKPVSADAKAISFETNLTEGSHRISPIFETEHGEVGAYYTVVTKLP